MIKQLLSLFAITLTLTSCDPTFAVILNNNSNKERSVMVIPSHGESIFGKDSITIADTSRVSTRVDGVHLQNIPITKEALPYSYSFVLGTNKKALLQGGIGIPDRDQKIIIDQYDTIRLRHDKRTKIRKLLGKYTEVSITIQ